MTYYERQSLQPDLQASLLERLKLGVGVPVEEAKSRDWLHAAALAVRERLVARWHETNRQVRKMGLKQVSYLSMEFLMARELKNGLMALGLEDECRAALAELGVPLDALYALEPDPALGNGGLGRLAACFLDSMANLGLPGMGYGIRYEYGMFRQELANGWQVEHPDDWLGEVNPWEFPRPERTYRVRFGGRVEHRGSCAHCVDTEDVFATAYDRLVPGHDRQAVITLRLWSPKPLEPIDLGAFNSGRFVEALVPKVRSETVARVLYPDDSTAEGRELRLRQEYFFASASVQDVLARFRAEHDDWRLLPEKVAIHLNDTHPALAPVELMRLLVDEHGVHWSEAWRLTQGVCAYTNHTLMPEALEVWPAELLRRVVPRHLEIIAEIDRRFLEESGERRGSDQNMRLRVCLIQDDGERRVNMGRLSVLASRCVNGVSRLHSRLVSEQLFADFARMYPERFTNVTNGITHRRWLVQSNPGLSRLIDESIGRGWRQNFERLADLSRFAEDRAFRERMRQVKWANKEQLAALITDQTGLKVDPAALFDVQVKRIHEYKRQLLNILGVIARWNAIRAEPARDWAPRVVVIAGKAASAYWLAKLIIKLACDVGARINNDPVSGDRLKLVFLPNYNVSLAELIIPAANLSQQISLAGTEASGTGNMKLALNGALTIGTADGANIEIAEAVGRENVFMFGLGVEEAQRLKAQGYAPHEIYLRDGRVREVLDQIAGGVFSPDEPERFRAIVEGLLEGGDRYLVLADFASYWAAQINVDDVWAKPEIWTARAVRNIAAMGPFSSDRAIREYTERIWEADFL
jgi:starch phosphorylase